MRNLLALILTVLTLNAHARQITHEEASAVASEFFSNSSNYQEKGKKATSKRTISPKLSDNNTPQAYYIFNADDNRGFVIVSGDDRVPKILGYSDHGNFNFNNMPPQLSTLLDQYTKNVKSLPDSAPVDASWRDNSPNSEGLLLETANWGQDYPYNALTPVVDGEHCPTGCVATAMAIVMYYHKWPENYDWATILNLEEKGENSQEIAKLMKDVGESVLMNYQLAESSANMNWVGHKLQHDFNYSPDCQFISSSNFSDDEWISMIKSNIDSGNPVIYNGTGNGGNHAFIIDGYNSYGYHINWGWSGFCNGYFSLDALTPTPNQDFSNAKGMVINITPDKTGTQYSNVFCDWGYFWATSGMISGSHFSIDSPKQGDEFDFTCYTLSYPCGESGRIGLVLFDKDGKVKEILNSNVYTETRDDFGLGFWGSDITFMQNKINSNVNDDDYITLATQRTLSDPWCEVLGTLESPVKKSIMEIKKDIGSVTIVNNVPNTRISYSPNSADRYYLEEGSNEIEFTKGLVINLAIEDIDGMPCKDVIISVNGKDLYGDINLFYEASATFPIYSDNYYVTFALKSEEEEKEINLAEAGSLNVVLQNDNLLNIGALTIYGNIDATDLWFIRDNIKGLERLDLSQAKILACDAIDPVPSFRDDSNEIGKPEDVLPSYALTGLNRLNALKLPKILKAIESNSLMSLGISEIEIPADVTSIGLNVFFDCKNLNTIVSKMATPPHINECIFTETMCPESGVLYVPLGSGEDYRNTSVWQDFAQIIENNDPITGNQSIMNEGLMYRMQGNGLYLIGYEQSDLPKDVKMPENIEIYGDTYKVIGIDDNALENADFDSLIMPNTVTGIGGFIFTNSTVKKVVMSDNITNIPFNCINGDYIEELHLPENAEWICNSIYCPSLKKLHLPKNIKSEIGYNGSIGSNFRSLDEISVDPENEEWSVIDGVLYWKGRSNLIMVCNNYEGELIISDETEQIHLIENCNAITKIVFGKNVKTVGYSAISNCENLRHIEFSNNLLITGNNVLHSLPALESFAIGDFIWSYGNCFESLHSLKYVYLTNENHVDFRNNFYNHVNPIHSYYSGSVRPQVSVPVGCNLYIPGRGSIEASDLSGNEISEMWKYEINRSEGKLKIEPLIDEIIINQVSINGSVIVPEDKYIYNFTSAENQGLNVVVNFTLHGMQPMTTHYDNQFNASIPDTSFTLTGINETNASKDIPIEIYSIDGSISMDYNCDNLQSLPSGIYIIRKGNNSKKIIVK